MATRVAITHTTRYDYAKPAALSPQLVRLRPAPHTRTPIHAYSLLVSPQPHFINWQQDPHGNHQAHVVFPDKVPHFEVKVDVVADLEVYNPFDFFLEPYAEQFPFRYANELREDLQPFLRCEAAGPALVAFIERFDKRPRSTIDFLVSTNRALNQAVQYVIRMEPGVQTPEQTLSSGRGSCRDSAWLLVQLLRNLGLAARFVSGYLVQLKPDVAPATGPSGPSEDFTDLHAWCECFVPGAGWVGLDPTSGLLAAEGHIPVACTPEPSTAAPVSGSSEQVDTRFAFSMSLARLIDVPRVTKPYSDEAWHALLALGERVDAQLAAQDVRLTMGGEPTFVSAHDADAPEWNTDALGPNKEALADRLLRRLHAQWAPGGLLFHGQGKWYPGEPLPRWAFACYQRRDGVPLWQDPRWFAAPDAGGAASSEDAQRFVQALIAELQLTRHGLQPAYEDAWYYLWRERRLPANVDVLDARLDDPLERERLRRVFHQGLGSVVGWVLPLGYEAGWYSGDLFLKSQHCFLLPGDSPMGLRLPLDSLPWQHANDRLGTVEPDPTVVRPALPSREELRAPRQPVMQTRTASAAFSAPVPFASANGNLRTALCVEPRGGRLRVFLPPLPSLEAFVELAAAIERTCEKTGLPVLLEGYPPVQDARLSQFGITPDPGVIEVNVPPLARFSELVAQAEVLADCVQSEGLTAEKFDLDGSHIGSGGGHHLVLGAATPLESPFLRRPELLSSLIAYFNNHPALSYFFAGRFIGPTSQAPRVDEARHESLHELEIALLQLGRQRQDAPPWLVDRVLRHLLVDVTGNTHRSELCIDKLYSPDSTTGRLGLLELRGFEMAPHARMGIAQQLLVRALIAAFWRVPYQRPLIHWGTVLHDKFMLPHFLRQDLLEVLGDLEGWGFPCSPSWFEPHYEFRFPHYGSVTKDAVSLELRGALEPWSVLGEEALASGQTRFVDSSLERLQVKLNNVPGGRYTACCNGVEIPLHDTGTAGEQVAGVRYRAWHPPSCLHPTIGIHGPLRFEIYDRWNGRAIAGCKYHVVHPGGRANLERPVNAVAAESRRIARFERAGHQPGKYAPTPYEPLRGGINASFPMTLDLRRL